MEEQAKYIPQRFRINQSIGIDPDLDKSGLACWCSLTNEFTVARAVPFWGLLDYINSVEVGTAHFWVDAGWLNEGYHHYASLPKEFATWSQKSKDAYLISCGVRVGQNFGVGRTIVAYLTAMQHTVTPVRPTQAKWDKETLKRYTGYDKRTNEETRDAMRLAWVNK